MESPNDPSAYLALLLASTSPTPARPANTGNPYAQPAVPVSYPVSNIREQPLFNASPGSMNFILPPGHNSHPMQFSSAAGLRAPLPKPYMGTFAPQYPASPYLTGSPAYYQPYQQQVHQQVASGSRVQEEDVEMDDEDDIIPQVRTAKQDNQPEESEAEEKPGRSLRRFRKKRKQTPVLVFDDDSDDGDYKEAPRKSTKRVKYDYDSEGAIDADAVHSSSEEPPELAPEPKEEPVKSKPIATRTSTRKPRSYKDASSRPKGKTSGADAKARSEKASALLNRKGKGRPIPKTVQECDEADLMMWQWKHSGRNWKDIRNEWIRIMGVVPGRSSLSVRLAKMEDNFIDSGAGNDLMILKYKAEVEAELEDVKWKKVAAKIKKETNGDAKPASIRKRYLQLQESGWVVGTGTEAGDGDVDGDGHENGGNEHEHGSEIGEADAAEEDLTVPGQDQRDSVVRAGDEECG